MTKNQKKFKELLRLYQCLSCPYFKECADTIEIPVDDINGWCETQKEFKKKYLKKTKYDAYSGNSTEGKGC